METKKSSLPNPYRIKANAFIRTNSETRGSEYPLVIISMEGTKTELQYFNGLKKAICNKSYQYKAVYNILPLEKNDTNSDPESVIDLLDEYIERDPKGHVDAIYAAVIDRDQNELLKFIQRCKNNPKQEYQLFVTSPCFEFFLLMHLDEKIKDRDDLDKIKINPIESSGHTYISKIISDLTHSRKKIDFCKYYLEQIDLALKNSQYFECDIYKLQDSVGSNLPMLFEIIHGIKKSIWK